MAPTDAALGASIMEDVRVPLRVRRDLKVESGLNDGIATPFVMFFIAGAAAATEVADSEGAGSAAIELAIGVGGMAFGTVKAGDNATLLSFNDKSGELLSLLVWFLFGATMIGPAFEHVEAMEWAPYARIPSNPRASRTLSPRR